MPLAQDAQPPQPPEGLPTDAELLGHGLGFKPGGGSSGHHGGGWGQRLPIWNQALWATITTLAPTSPSARSTEGATEHEAGKDREALADVGVHTALWLLAKEGHWTDRLLPLGGSGAGSASGGAGIRGATDAGPGEPTDGGGSSGGRGAGSGRGANETC
jgi:hypothetical protein